MKKRTILICDDETQIRKRWKAQLDALLEVQTQFIVVIVENDDLRKGISGLEHRRRDARKGQSGTFDNESVFDKADILIIDYDLLKISSESYITGEGVSYLARCYSRCGLIIAVNQYGANTFDLTLKGHPESFADLNLGSRQIINPGLWSQPWTGFRPWYWPLLPRSLDSFHKRVNQLLEKGALNQRIMTFLGFPDETVKLLPRSTREFLGPGKEPEKTTFLDFVKDSGNGLRRKDKALGSEAVARIAAARIAKWMERLVLPGQDILVDAPHVVSRFPSLLTGDVRQIDSWNKATVMGPYSSLGLKWHTLRGFTFDKVDWLSRPAWFWSPLGASERIREVTSPWSVERPDFVFCEDISRFLRLGAARPFVSELPSPFVKRFVVDPTSSGGRSHAREVNNVDYRPSDRFSL